MFLNGDKDLNVCSDWHVELIYAHDIGRDDGSEREPYSSEGYKKLNWSLETAFRI